MHVCYHSQAVVHPERTEATVVNASSPVSACDESGHAVSAVGHAAVFLVFPQLVLHSVALETVSPGLAPLLHHPQL